MPSLDNNFWPFDNQPGWSSMAPCMRSCDHIISYNGCDIAACWCNKGNLDLRMSSMTRCASSSCTFANMNTLTDMTIMSGIQVQYCVDHQASPAGMALPTSVDAVPTDTSAAFATGTAKTGTRAASGPAATSDVPSSETTSPAISSAPISQPSQTSASTSGNNDLAKTALSTAAKTGIGIGIAACALLAILIILLLLKRKKKQPQYYPPPPNYQGGIPPPNMNMNMTPAPAYGSNGPFSPPPLQQPMPVHTPQNHGYVGNMGDVSPVSEKAVPVSTTPKVSRKEVGKSKTDVSVVSTPTTTGVQPPLPTSTNNMYPHEGHGPMEVPGSVPPPRHEVSNDGQITNTVTTRGMELDSNQQPLNQYPGQQQYPGQGQYQQSGQGYPQYGNTGAHEVDGGQSGWGQRQELAGGQGGYQAYEMPGHGQQGQQGYSGQGNGQVHEMPEWVPRR